MKNKTGSTIAFIPIGVVISFLMATVGQLSPTLAQSGASNSSAPRARRLIERRERASAAMEFVRLLRALDLSGKQRSDISAIVRGYESTTRTHQGELRRLDNAATQAAPTATDSRASELREGLRQATANMQTEVRILLTVEQRARLDGLMINQNQRSKIRNPQEGRINGGEFHRARGDH